MSQSGSSAFYELFLSRDVFVCLLTRLDHATLIALASTCRLARKRCGQELWTRMAARRAGAFDTSSMDGTEHVILLVDFAETRPAPELPDRNSCAGRALFVRTVSDECGSGGFRTVTNRCGEFFLATISNGQMSFEADLSRCFVSDTNWEDDKPEETKTSRTTETFSCKFRFESNDKIWFEEFDANKKLKTNYRLHRDKDRSASVKNDIAKFELMK